MPGRTPAVIELDNRGSHRVIIIMQIQGCQQERMRWSPSVIQVAMVAVLLCATIPSCYSSKEVMLRNPAHIHAVELLSPDPDAKELLSEPDQLPSYPGGYHDSTFASVNPAQPIVDPRRPIWRITESNPNIIKTIYYDANMHVNPSGYAWEGNQIDVMISRDYEFKTLNLKMERVDSLLAVYTHYDGRKTRNAILIGGGLGTIVGILMIGYSNYWFD